VVPGSKGHSGIDDQRGPVSRRALPGGKDRKAFADINGGKAFFPGLVPVSIREQTVLDPHGDIVSCRVHEQGNDLQFPDDNAQRCRCRKIGGNGMALIKRSKRTELCKLSQQRVLELLGDGDGDLMIGH
jgi:hypothetical protein